MKILSFILVTGLCLSKLSAQPISSQHEASTPSNNTYTKSTSAGRNDNYSVKWAINPFDNKIFIQNLGQFDDSVVSTSKIFYGTASRNMDMYFTSSGVVYKYTEPLKSNIEQEGDKEGVNDPDKAGFQKPGVKYMKAEWVGSNPSVVIEADSIQTYYYAYALGKNNVRAGVYKKLTYKNLYPGIDVEYFFPAKGGIKYDVLVHPGADISVLKLKYTGANSLKLDKSGNVLVNTFVGDFIDHAPVSYYSDTKGKV
ncbi:MAG TPA: hypothetical protein VNY36_05405, partial [Bacteroidia bacterium]|nr:hypothetical protein [Bacteroidia bacterium]